MQLHSPKVNEASREKDRIHRRHMKAAKQFEEAEESKSQLQTSLQRSIVRAKPYFEVQQDFQMKLEVCSCGGIILQLQLLIICLKNLNQLFKYF